MLPASTATAQIFGRRALTRGVQSPYVRDSSTFDRQRRAVTGLQALPGRAARDRSHVPIGQWTMATLRMIRSAGGLTPCSAAMGIPGRPATSSSPTCRAPAAPTKASPGTPWSGARQTAAAQPGIARGTTRPPQSPPATLLSATRDLCRRPVVKRRAQYRWEPGGEPSSADAGRLRADWSIR
jgi:hypothetical protein